MSLNFHLFMSKYARLEGLDPDYRGDAFTPSYNRGIEFSNVGSALLVNLSRVNGISTSIHVTGSDDSEVKIYRIHFHCGKDDDITWIYPKYENFMADFQRLINVRSQI